MATPFTAQEIQQFRADTKGAAERIHFNNAGSSLPPDVVVDTTIAFLQEEARLGGYEIAEKYSGELAKVYSLIGQLINADAREIAITENASVAWSIAFHGIRFEAGDEIITTELEYVTNILGFIQAKQTQGVEIKIIPHDEQGRFDLAAFEAAITPRTKLIAVTHIGSTTGGILPVKAIGAVAKKHNILYLVDACQSVGHLPIDVKAIGCDMLSVTGRKYLRAPTGTGFLYVKQSVQDQLKPLFMDGFTTEWMDELNYKLHPDARRFELFEKNKALLLGLGKAVEYALQAGPDRIWQRIQYLATLLRQQLKTIEGVTVHDRGDEQSGIVTFSLKDTPGDHVRKALYAQNINVSVGTARATLYFMNKHSLNNIVRASVHYFNTEEEINTLCAAIKVL